MNDFELNLHLLSEALKQKTDLLEQILNISENQQLVLENPNGEDVNEFIKHMNNEKQTLIDEVLNNDRVFQNIFDKLGKDFEEVSAQYPAEVAGLQAMIKTVTSLDIKIRVQEDTNSRVRALKKAPQSVPKPAKSHLLSEYEKNNRISTQNRMKGITDEKK